MRHTYTSNLLANGAAPKDVQELLGHSDVSTTMNVYAHSTRKAKRESARLLDKVAGNDQKKKFPYFPYNDLIRAKIRENTYHFTNEQAEMPVICGKSARYFGKLELSA